MKIPGLDELLADLTARGDEMQSTLNRIEALLVQIEINTRSRSTSGLPTLYAGDITQ